MRVEAVVAVLVAFAAMGVLPRIFFRKDGTFNLRWWFTASPFFVSAASVALSFGGVVPVVETDVSRALSVVAVVLAMASLALITFSLGTHRIPLALWHQDNDEPAEIVTWGAYRAIRHPFYTAFILMLLAACLLAPSILTASCLAAGVVGLGITARREEQRLCQSRFGRQYQTYIETTGRFFPRLRPGTPGALTRSS
jgi:protein-S-isoprenylcysteine O-methyltransferase Ste14